MKSIRFIALAMLAACAPAKTVTETPAPAPAPATTTAAPATTTPPTTAPTPAAPAPSATALTEAPRDWQLLDASADRVVGISGRRAEREEAGPIGRLTHQPHARRRPRQPSRLAAR